MKKLLTNVDEHDILDKLLRQRKNNKMKIKKFKKVVLKKTVKKTSFTLKSKKLKNKKKLYVRARALKKVGKKTYTSKWSKVKKVKIKK